MDDGLSPLETQVRQLARRLAALEQRLASLEARDPAVAGRAAVAAAAVEPDALDRLAGLRAADIGIVAALVGRTLVVLAGAYLLRALTDSGWLAVGPGVLLGLLFALGWILMADRAGAQRRGLSAAFYGGSFVLVAFPLLFEASTRFHLLSVGEAAAGLTGCATAALAVAARRRLQGFAWVATVAALAAGLALMFATAELGGVALFLILLGATTLWLGYLLDWTLLGWPVALVADLTVVVLSGRAVTPGVADPPGMAVGAQALLLASYLGSFAIWTLLLNRDVRSFEVLQSVAAIAVGLGGAAYVTGRVGAGALPLGLTTLALATGCYGVALAVVGRPGRRRTFHFYATAGLVFAVAGCAILLPRPALGLTCAALGLAAAWAGRLSRRMTFRAHAAAYLAAAVVASGLLPHVAYGLGLPAAPVHTPSGAMLGILALCTAALWGLGASAAEGPFGWAARMPRLVGVLLAVGGVLGIAMTGLSVAMAGGKAAAVQPGLVATLRTGLLVAAVVALAWGDRALEFVEGAWLVYPLLVLTGVKFIFEDFRAGRPATLFVGFAVYGLGLIVGPWLCRRPIGAKRARR